MKLSEFEGKVLIQYEAQADNTLPEGPLRLAGILRYQACNDQGRCFRPESVEWATAIPAR